MTPIIFEQVVRKLQTQWPNSYGDERKKQLWEKLKNMPDEFMVDACNEFLASSRGAPLLNEFLTYRDNYKNRKAQYKQIENFDIQRQMQNWASVAPNKEFARKCCDLLNQKVKGKITHQQFLYEIDNLKTTESIPCNKCHDGIVYKKHIKTGDRFIFQCTCDMGKARMALPVYGRMEHSLYV